jgi:flagellar basal-body rod modification protein FlgD
MAAAGILTHSLTAGGALTPLDSSSSSSGAGSTSGSSSSADTGSATISANDFLQLLVTEMQNQDPTDQTDPNEYIDQLVDVNSLEQLIDINQTLSGAFGTSSTSDAASAQQTAGVSGTPSSSSALNTATSPSPGAAAPGSTSVSAPAYPPGPFHPGGTPSSAASNSVSGNLSMPAAIPAAQRVAHALDGRPARGRPLGGKLAGIAQNPLNNRP